MAAIVEEVTTTKVNLNFPVPGTHKKEYAKLFKEFAGNVSDEHPDLAIEFEGLSRVLAGRKKRTVKVKKAEAPKVVKKKRKPPRRAEATTSVGVEEPDEKDLEQIETEELLESPDEREFEEY